MTILCSGSTELTGADWFLVSLERMMRLAGQGEHTSLTVLKLGDGFDLAALHSAAARLAEASQVAAGRLKKIPLGVARWRWETGDQVQFPVREHPINMRWEEVARNSLGANSATPVSFDVIPSDSGAIVILRWWHSLLDGRGAELFLAEIARLAVDPMATPKEASWGRLPTQTKGFWADLCEAKKFKDHYYKLAEQGIRSLGDAKPQPGGARFHIEFFDVAESERILARAAGVSRGLFQIGWFLAVSMRAHRSVFAARGERVESFQASCAVQARKRGARHPIWQNQVSQLFFGVRWDQLDDLAFAASLLHEQFEEMSRQRLDVAFASNVRIFRHLPLWFWLRTVRSHTGGYITSFFFSHTGECLPECNAFCGAPIKHAFHIPTVSQPPGTGIFFGQRSGQYTATFCWREGVLREGELEALLAQVREDLLGA